MKTIVFVYDQASFQIGGPHPLKQFQSGQKMLFSDAQVAAQPSSTPVGLRPGIYVIFSDADDVRAAITPVDGVPGTNYDLVEYATKDPWPDPPSATANGTLMAAGAPTLTGDEFTKLVASIHAKIPDLVDSDLKIFTDSLSR
jgi:hypothetical protein